MDEITREELLATLANVVTMLQEQINKLEERLQQNDKALMEMYHDALSDNNIISTHEVGHYF